MVGHNIEKYDIYQICLALAECEPEKSLKFYILLTKTI